MSTIITVNSLEQNIGVSSVVLTLSEKINYLTKKDTCILELDYANPSFSYVLEKAPIEHKSIDGLFAFINNETVVDDNLLNIIDFNKKTFRNSNIDIIYGSKEGRRFTSSQLNVLIAALRLKYEVIIVDCGKEIIPDILIDNTDINILLVQPSLRYINYLELNKKDYIHKKTHFLINNNSKGNSDIKFILNEKFKDTEIIGQLPNAENLNSTLNKGVINIEKGNYSKNLSKIAIKICLLLSMELKVKNSFIEKVIKKVEEREEDIFIRYDDKELLGEILIREKICTKEDIERCLKLQNKKLL